MLRSKVILKSPSKRSIRIDPRFAECLPIFYIEGREEYKDESQSHDESRRMRHLYSYHPLHRA